MPRPPVNPPSGNPTQPTSTLFAGSPGDLFNRIGAWGNLINLINAFRGTTIPAGVASADDQYLNTDQNIIDNLYYNESSYQNSSNTFLSQIRSMSVNTLIQMVNEVLPLNQQNLQSSMAYLVSLMQSEGQSVKACSVSSNISYGPGNVGNPVAVVSVRNPQGLYLEDLFAETATATVTNDFQHSANLAGSEPLNIQGQYNISDTFSWMYPAGSGINLSANAVNGMNQNQGGYGNWALNGSFENVSATANVPLNWAILAGVPGTTVFQTTSESYDGVYSLQFAGDGSTLSAVGQAFSTPTNSGTMLAYLYPMVQLCVNMFVTMSATPPSGVLQVALTNGSTPTTDNQGNINAASINLNTVGTSWIPFNAVFRTPSVMPTTPTLQIGLTTALPGGYNCYIDRVAVTQMVQLYQGGPYISIFSGDVNMLIGDTVFVKLNNDYGGQFQILFDKIFNMKSQGMLLPSNATGGATIPDTLI
jgi:hypothetical protein